LGAAASNATGARFGAGATFGAAPADAVGRMEKMVAKSDATVTKEAQRRPTPHTPEFPITAMARARDIPPRKDTLIWSTAPNTRHLKIRLTKLAVGTKRVN
jgi:hypothetical protein